VEERIQKLEEQVSEIRVKQAEIHGNISHIRTRIDNGMGKTIHEIAEKLDKYVAQSSAFQAESSMDRAVINQKLRDHGWWISAVKTFIFSLAGMAVTGGIVALFQMVPK